MILDRQRAIVEERSREATRCDLRRRQERAAIHRWKLERFANPLTLVLAFAAGALVGASSDMRLRIRPSEHLLGLANTTLLAWRMFGAHE